MNTLEQLKIIRKIGYDDILIPKALDAMTLEKINNYPDNKKLVVYFNSTKDLTSSFLKKIDDKGNIFFYIADDFPLIKIKKLKGEGAFWFRNFLYYKEELLPILEELEQMSITGTDLVRLKIICQYIRENFTFNWTFFEEGTYKEFSSLNTYLSKRATCLGLAVVFQDLCARADLSCSIILDGVDHCLNSVLVDGKKYQVDITSDVIAYHNGKVSSSVKFVEQDSSQVKKTKGVQAKTNFNLPLATHKTVIHEASRCDGSRFAFTLLTSENKAGPSYTYLYFDVDDGKYLNPMLVSSNYNASYVFNNLKNYQRIKKFYLYYANNFEKFDSTACQDLNRLLNEKPYLEQQEFFFCNQLFTKENLYRGMSTLTLNYCDKFSFEPRKRADNYYLFVNPIKIKECVLGSVKENRHYFIKNDSSSVEIYTLKKENETTFVFKNSYDLACEHSLEKIPNFGERRRL